MAPIQKEILDAFYASLAKSPEFDPPTVESIRLLFEAEKKLKAEDFVVLLSKKAAEKAP